MSSNTKTFPRNIQAISKKYPRLQIDKIVNFRVKGIMKSLSSLITISLFSCRQIFSWILHSCQQEEHFENSMWKKYNYHRCIHLFYYSFIVYFSVSFWNSDLQKWAQIVSIHSERETKIIPVKRQMLKGRWGFEAVLWFPFSLSVWLLEICGFARKFWV